MIEVFTEIAAELHMVRTFVVAGIVAVFALGIIQIVDAIVWAFREHPSRATGAAVVAFFVVASIGSAFSHEAPTGWSFDPMCCGSFDCYQVQDDAIGEGPDGYVVRETGEIIPYQSYRAKNSPDGLTYRCSVGGDPQAHTYCIYKPKGGA